MADLTFYTNPMSRGQIARWMLHEVGADYEQVLLDYGTTMKAPDYLAVNPMGKVPALKVGDTVITETAAIITWLADYFALGRLIPQIGTLERGQYYRWLCFAIHFEYAMMDKWQGVPTSAERRKAIGYGDFDTALNTLRQILSSREYLLGNAFSVLDLYLASLLNWSAQVAGVLPDDAVFTGYTARVTDREAFHRAAALDNELLAAINT